MFKFIELLNNNNELIVRQFYICKCTYYVLKGQ